MGGRPAVPRPSKGVLRVPSEALEGLRVPSGAFEGRASGAFGGPGRPSDAFGCLRRACFGCLRMPSEGAVGIGIGIAWPHGLGIPRPRPVPSRTWSGCAHPGLQAGGCARPLRRGTLSAHPMPRAPCPVPRAPCAPQGLRSPGCANGQNMRAHIPRPWAVGPLPWALGQGVRSRGVCANGQIQGVRTGGRVRGFGACESSQIAGQAAATSPSHSHRSHRSHLSHLSHSSPLSHLSHPRTPLTPLIPLSHPTPSPRCFAIRGEVFLIFKILRKVTRAGVRIPSRTTSQ